MSKAESSSVDTGGLAVPKNIRGTDLLRPGKFPIYIISKYHFAELARFLLYQLHLSDMLRFINQTGKILLTGRLYPQAMKHEDKTNVMRLLDGKKIPYSVHSYTPDSSMTGEDIAALLNEPPERVFKTLVTQGKNGISHYVFIIPVNTELDLKKAAKAAGEKSVSMIKQKDLLPLTGYIHGGCSPIGMKKKFPAFIHVTASEFESIFVSAGKVGCQIELNPEDLISIAECKPADIACS